MKCAKGLTQLSLPSHSSKDFDVFQWLQNVMKRQESHWIFHSIDHWVVIVD